MWSAYLWSPNFEFKELLYSFWKLFGTYWCRYLVLASFMMSKELILAASKFGIPIEFPQKLWVLGPISEKWWVWPKPTTPLLWRPFLIPIYEYQANDWVKKMRHDQKLAICKKSTFFCPILMKLGKNDYLKRSFSPSFMRIGLNLWIFY